MLCFVVVMQSFIMNSHEVCIHIHQGCFAGTGAIVRLPQCQWSKPGGYGKISQCITTTKHSKAKTVCIILGINCSTNERLFCTNYHTSNARAGFINKIYITTWQCGMKLTNHFCLSYGLCYHTQERTSWYEKSLAACLYMTDTIAYILQDTHWHNLSNVKNSPSKSIFQYHK